MAAHHGCAVTARRKARAVKAARTDRMVRAAVRLPGPVRARVAAVVKAARAAVIRITVGERGGRWSVAGEETAHRPLITLC